MTSLRVLIFPGETMIKCGRSRCCNNQIIDRSQFLSTNKRYNFLIFFAFAWGELFGNEYKDFLQCLNEEYLMPDCGNSLDSLALMLR